jgi:ABC-type amino acid transport substrate-binding protein
MTTVGYGDRSPVTLWGRIVAIIWMFASIIVISGLTGTIAASLTVRNLVPGIKSFADLPGRRIGTVASSSSDTYLQSEGFRKIHYYEDVPSAQEALHKHEIDAIVYDAPILKYYLRTTQDATPLAFVEDNIARQQYAFALSEDHEMIESINQALLKQTFQASWASTLETYIPKPGK